MDITLNKLIRGHDSKRAVTTAGKEQQAKSKTTEANKEVKNRINERLLVCKLASDAKGTARQNIKGL